VLAFIPIVGPASAIMLIVGWQIIKLLFVVTGNGASLVGWAPTATGTFNIRGYYDGNGLRPAFVSDVIQLTVVGE